MNFQESIEYLYGLGNEVLAMKLGLENITKLLDALGNPQKNYLKIQIAGTNGKGSTVAFLESICVSAGIKTGATTSPHLISITERVKIGGVEISEKDFANYATIVRETSEKLVENFRFQISNSKLENKESGIPNLKSEIFLETVPTFFEQVTAIALLAFDDNKVELAILETGIGGRFDATTAANAEIVAITPIDLDHQKILGESLSEIAAEKAAIIRKDTKVFVAPQKKEVEKVIYGKCREVQVEPTWATEIIETKVYSEENYPIISTSFKTEKDNYSKVILGLNGRHQFINASLAIGIAETLREFDFKISNQDIWLGLETARHRGRLEFYEGILFDGAHNVAGAIALREYLNEFINQPITMIFGAMRDKNLTEIAQILFMKADKLIFTKPDNPRSMEMAELLKFVPKNFDRENVIVTETVADALNTAKKITNENELILVTGSLYLVGEVQKIMNNKSEI